jgi:glycyl-tRNA synthetase beta chain
MPDLLLELFSEEIPARMQVPAAEALKRLALDALQEAKLAPASLETFVTPRRLTLIARGIPATQPDAVVEKRGPRLGAPDAALAGFLNSTGLTKDQLEIREKGGEQYYFAVEQQQGQSAATVLPALLEQVIASILWPKSMRWGESDIRWVRPLHRILCLLDSTVLPVTFGHLEAGNLTEGHRFLAPGAIAVTGVEQYLTALAGAKVVLSQVDRKTQILHTAQEAAAARGLVLVEDEGLLDEVTGLVEWPVAYIGGFDAPFMVLPPEVLTAEMRAHQKYFALKTREGAFAPHFLVISNMESRDAGAYIVNGNERVLRARLADGAFFWDQDLKTPLSERAKQLSTVVFHAKLGTIADKVDRVKGLAKFLAVWVPHAGLKQVERAAQLAKADLVSGMVGEFPELQGIMGRYYAEHQGEDAEVAAAIDEHYAPRGAADRVPTRPVSVTLALADKIDTLAGMFAAGEIPTGSKDPFALRRAALGLIRILLENQLKLPLKLAFEQAVAAYPASLLKDDKAKPAERKQQITEHLLSFTLERLKQLLKAQSFRHDVIDAVFASSEEDTLVSLVARTQALSDFLRTQEGESLLAATKRAVNILKIEEKKDRTRYNDSPDPALLEDAQEQALYAALSRLRPVVQKHVKDERYHDAMAVLAELRAPVDAFFEQVTVNASDANIRRNRLRLLAQIQSDVMLVADVSRIEG